MSQYDVILVLNICREMTTGSTVLVTAAVGHNVEMTNDVFAFTICETVILLRFD